MGGITQLVKTNTGKSYPVSDLSSTIEDTLGTISRNFDAKAKVELIKAMTGLGGDGKDGSPLRVLKELNEAGFGVGQAMEIHKAAASTLAEQLDRAERRAKAMEEELLKAKSGSDTGQAAMLQMMLGLLTQMMQQIGQQAQSANQPGALAQLTDRILELQQRNMELILERVDGGRGPDPLRDLGERYLGALVDRQLGGEPQDPKKSLMDTLALANEIRGMLGAAGGSNLDEKRLALEEKKLDLEMRLKAEESKDRLTLEEKRGQRTDSLLRAFSEVLPGIVAVAANKDGDSAGSPGIPDTAAPPRYTYRCSACGKSFDLPEMASQVICPYCSTKLVTSLKGAEASGE